VCHTRLSGNCIILSDILCDMSESHGARGDVSAGNLRTASGDRLFRKP
jgi:hypothetical protein